MNYGETRDYLTARVHWTPDSRAVVIHRLNRVQDHLWIMAADAATGRATTLIEETDPAWVNLSDDFRFLSDGRILLTSEKDGFRHIYLHSAAGKEVARLTRGEWEVSSVACVDQAARRVYYVSTGAGPAERHLYSVSFDGKDKRQLTKGEGTHGINMSPACDFYTDSYSNIENPSQTTLHRADGSQLAVIREADRKILDEYVILKTEIHKFKGADGTLFYGRLIRPANLEAGKKYPVLVQIYGGPHAQSVRNSFSGISLDQALAQRGYVIWQMDNRGSSGRGHKFEAPLYRRMGKQELEDQKEGIKYLLSLGFADPDRIAVNGWSYGGYMTLYCLLHAPEVFKAGIAGAAVTDWRNYDTIYTERYMGLPQENEQGYKDSSPVTAAANLKGRLLMLHNIEDDNVLFANFLQMTNAFQLANKPYQSIVYPQKSHGVTGRARTHMTETMVRFLDEALK
jgi:dipeptidyl-peptidase-4